MKATATKAHAAGIVTSGSTLLVAWLNGNIETSMIESLGAAVAVGIAGWIATYLPENKPK